jgi:hypothetical protein
MRKYLYSGYPVSNQLRLILAGMITAIICGMMIFVSYYYPML